VTPADSGPSAVLAAQALSIWWVRSAAADFDAAPRWLGWTSARGHFDLLANGGCCLLDSGAARIASSSRFIGRARPLKVVDLHVIKSGDLAQHPESLARLPQLLQLPLRSFEALRCERVEAVHLLGDQPNRRSQDRDQGLLDPRGKARASRRLRADASADRGAPVSEEACSASARSAKRSRRVRLSTVQPPMELDPGARIGGTEYWTAPASVDTAETLDG
jgi:hypothetical protein